MLINCIYIYICPTTAVLTECRFVSMTTGSILPACLLVATGYAGCNHTLAVVLLTLGVGGGGFTMAGYNVNHLDIAPKFAGE